MKRANTENVVRVTATLFGPGKQYVRAKTRTVYDTTPEEVIKTIEAACEDAEPIETK